MGNKSSTPHLQPTYPRGAIHPYYLNAHHHHPPPGHPLCPGPPHPFVPPPFHHQSMTSLHHPNGTDSGYMTSPADTERWKAHNWKNGQSRLSLNEAFIYETTAHPPPPPAFMAMPPPSPKQLKKWHKKHKKLLKKMASMPPPILPPQPPPLPPYSRAYSMDNLNNCNQMLDGYAELPAVSKKGWKSRKEHRKSHHFGEQLPEVPAGPPRSTVSSGCSNGFVVSELRCGPSTNLSEHSRVTSTNTDHSSSVIRSHSSLASKHSPSSHFKKDAHHAHISGNRFPSTTPSNADAAAAAADRTLIDSATPDMQHPHRSVATNTTMTNATVNTPQMDQASRRNFSTGQNCTGSRRSNDVVIVHDYDHHGDDGSTVKHHSNSSHFNNIPLQQQQQQHNQTHHWKKQSDEHRYISRTNENNHRQLSPGAATTTTTDETLDSVVAERTIPIKITSEAKRILERNAQLFPRNEQPENEQDNSEISRSETALSNGDSLQSGTTAATTNRYFSSHSATVAPYQSLKRNADYGSTISSLTQSSNMKTEMSDIDFSWVDDVENRLEKEIAFVKEDYPRRQMPVRYFGMDDADVPMSDSAQRAPSERMVPLMRTSEAFEDSEPRRELNEIRSDVRSKAAMFDDAAVRNAQSIPDCQPQMGSRYRSRSASRPDQSPMYIPQPDYNNYEPISVDTSSQANTQRYFGFRAPNEFSTTAMTMSPSERRLRKFEHNNGSVNAQSSANIAHDAAATAATQNPPRYGPRTVMMMPQRPNDPNEQRNEILQRNRTYDATEYYRQNAARRKVDKPWRASVAY